jgi:hypothetical protein
VPKVDKEPVSSNVRTVDPKPVVLRGKVLLARSPQADQPNRNTHPGIAVTSKPKRTSAEVAAAAKCKADLQRQADEFEQMQIETLAEMELQEELDEEAAERSVVRKQAEASSLDDAEDVKEGGEDKGTSTNKANSELPDDETEAEGKVEPKGKQVLSFQISKVMNTITEVP